MEVVCGDPQCDRPPKTRGLCQAHYMRQWSGSTYTGPIKRIVTDISSGFRECSRCGASKALTEFYKNKKGLGGFTADCKTCNKAVSRKWRTNNLDQKRASARRSSSKRRAVKRGCVCDDSTLESIRAFQGDDCAYCGCVMDFSYNHYAPNKATLDHVLALSRGGDHVRSNLVIACNSCNMSKGTKTPTEWSR